ncbi:hypothetical protein MJG53_018666 [Ovis ammon polii x Ovis aries]|uniref:Protein Wnt n=2 Tax=Ovis TaxID=9935 RepID=A0AAD4TM12_OVIAM|nr:hypothetical protein MG293_019472 [Ovis ammon polii]KAI4557913.1 hypothetical protein MJG53_018666 [Ovis ammon polii x Ovis aries]
MPAHLLQEEISSSYTTTTTITAPPSRVLQNGGGKLEKTPLYLEEDIRPEMRDDIYDPTYQDKEGPKPKLEYVWRNIILMGLLHLGALYGITLIPTCKIYTFLWVLFYYVISALGITAGVHRLWSHRTYKARLPLRVFLIIANTMAFQNDVFEWSRDHRAHHKFSETDADPHNSRRGFFFSHVGWLLVRKHPAVREKGATLDLSDLRAEKLVMFQRRYYKPGVLLLCFILPTLVPWYLWGETFQNSLFFATFLRYAVVLNATWLVNSAAHMYGYRPYDKTINPRENILVSLGAVGEGFHNYHHTFPYDYSASEYRWHINFTTFFIDCMAAIGLAYDRKKNILSNCSYRHFLDTEKFTQGYFPNFSILRYQHSVRLCASSLRKTLSVNNFLMTGPKAYLIYSSSVAAGAQSGIEECKYQFAWDRWNCPERALQLSSHGGLRGANRETAFVHAISSAGVMYTLTRNCSLGDFDNCGCDDSRNGQLGGQGWLWGGCSDNVGFGEAISKQFVDALETGQDARAAMNLHNNEAGRKAVKGTMKRTCKCHGVSGSCTTQTCWLQLPEFREVGAHLKEKYHAALKVDLLQGAGNSAAGRGAIADTFRSISTRELVHLEDSPDYCLENKTLGLLGTEGRECLRRGRALGRWERRSCRRLCGDCGLAVEERRAETVSSCNCKFHWCCAVRCEQCRRRVTKYFCSRADRPRGGAAHEPGRKP